MYINRTKFTTTKINICRRNRATLRVIEYFATSRKVTQDYSKWRTVCVSAYNWNYNIPVLYITVLYLVPFLRYSASRLAWPWNRG